MLVHTCVSFLILAISFEGTVYLTSLDTALSRVNYVTPSRAIPCPSDQIPCFTLEEYADQQDKYIVNDTIFYFFAGAHVLNRNLTLVSIHNFTLHSLSGSENRVVSIVFETSVSITWKKCWHIEISSVMFNLTNNFTYGIVFEHVCWIKLSNISIVGNGNSGYSSVLIQDSTLNISDSNFTRIKGTKGAALLISDSSSVIFTGENIFDNNEAALGGAIYLSDSLLTFTGLNIFESNTALYDERTYCGNGGAIYCSNSILTLGMHSVFVHNFAYCCGGAIAAEHGYNNITVVGSALFHANSGGYCGGAIDVFNAKVEFRASIPLSNNGMTMDRLMNVDCDYDNNIQNVSTTKFVGNYARVAGAVNVFYSIVKFNTGTVSFHTNTANGGSGAIECDESTLTFVGSAIFDRNVGTSPGSGAIHSRSSRLKFIGAVFFGNNIATGDSYGGAMSSISCNVTFVGLAIFISNTAGNGGAITTILNDNIVFAGNVQFIRNVATADLGGAIYTVFGKLMFEGNIHFEENTAQIGGAISFEVASNGELKSMLILMPPLNMSFIQNRANDTGGALNIRDHVCSLATPECCISIGGPSTTTKNISLLFVNNSAGSSGSTLYGGHLNNCRLCYKTSTIADHDQCACNEYSEDALGTFMNMSKIFQNKNSATNISSPGEGIEFCYDFSDSKTVKAYPGGQFKLGLVALGQSRSPVPATLLSTNRFIGDNFRLSPVKQNITNSCTNASFQVYSNSEDAAATFHLYIDNPCQSLAVGLFLGVEFLPCPLGFSLSKIDQMCTCNEKILPFTQNCYIGTFSIERIKNNFWISKANNDTIILHGFRCPLDYCKIDSVNVSLDIPRAQCDFNRNSILCGHCDTNFSLALGSLHCLQCSHQYLALLVLFALAGIILIVFIFLLRLTVAFGTMNALLFYANIIQANHQTFFPRATINFFTVFISWLNLDLGIETCFYDGMGIYEYSWMQFAFPFYVWFLIGCIIVISRYSRSFARILGQNPVAVLATLLLMSFSKILTATITPLSWTYLMYSNSSNESRHAVWLYDGSVNFFKEPKHTALGLFAILMIIIFVFPYIVLLFCGQWLLSCSDRKALSWINKLKPLMDAYQAPYKNHTRFWTGLLLLSRMGLFLMFAINTLGSQSTNLLAISSVTTALITLQVGRVYEHWYNDVLESIFLLNLSIFSVATFYLKEEINDDHRQLVLSSISVGIAIITFVGILTFHICILIKTTSPWNTYMLPYIQIVKQSLANAPSIIPAKFNNNQVSARENTRIPTSTVIEVGLCDSLISYT